MSWVVLVVAGLFETVWALALKDSHGFSKLAPTALFIVTLVVSMLLLAIALRDLVRRSGRLLLTAVDVAGGPDAQRVCVYGWDLRPIPETRISTVVFPDTS